jgi:hypothetical protein
MTSVICSQLCGFLITDTACVITRMLPVLLCISQRSYVTMAASLLISECNATITETQIVHELQQQHYQPTANKIIHELQQQYYQPTAVTTSASQAAVASLPRNTALLPVSNTNQVYRNAVLDAKTYLFCHV